jgi:hypothetical protein
MISVHPKLAHYIIAAITAAFLAAGCSKSSSNSPTSFQLSDFVGSVTTSDGSITATQTHGAPPVANGGPAVTPTVSGSSSAAVVSGGSALVTLRAASTFQTVNVSVIDDPLDGYFKLDLPAPTTSTTILIKLGGSVPASTFQIVFSVQLGTSVGPSASIANSLKTPTGVTVAGTSPTLGGAAQQFTATASFSDNTSQAVTDQAMWQSSATTVAQVSSGGLVTAIAAGDADITATFGTIIGRLHVTIAAASGGGGGSTFTVNGLVTDGSTGGVLPNVTITIGSKSTTTDATGNYTLSGISPGSITVVASATSYVTGQQTINLSANTRVDFTLARVVVTPTASIAIQNPPCTAAVIVGAGPPVGQPVTCTFVGSSTNITSPTYGWTFTNPSNGMTLPASGAQVKPAFDCTFDFGHSTFTVNVALTVSGNGGPASASMSATMIRPAGQCGAN